MIIKPKNIKTSVFRKIFLLTTIFIALVFFGINVAETARSLKSDYPRLANYYLRWEISDYEAEELSKWDLLVLDMEVQKNSPEQLKKIRLLNPDIIILAYITSQEIMDDFLYYRLAHLRPELKKNIIDSWYLKDSKGNKLTYWQNTHLLNLSEGAGKNFAGQRFNDFLPFFVKKEIESSGLWDGVFYDNIWGDVVWAAGADIDINNDGKADEINFVNRLWSEGVDKMISETINLLGNDFIVVGNGRIHWPYQKKLNGMMLENFPSSWEGDGSWAASVNNYLRLAKENKDPNVSIINTYDKNRENFDLMRFGLSSALLGDGFFSFDYDTSNHGQLWWYDEYDFNLGTAKGLPYNLIDGSFEIKNGFWRRDFKNGSVFVNSSNKTQTYIFTTENFSFLKGTQDSKLNNGERTNFLKLEPGKGLILKNNETPLTSGIFKNGYFYRYFNNKGEQLRNGGFVFFPNYPGESELAFFEQKNKQLTMSLVQGALKIEEAGKVNTNFRPFGNFKGNVDISFSFKNDVFDKYALGAGLGGGPQVLVFNRDNKLEKNFFAYDKNLRSGVNVVLYDLDNDGRLEIITAPGPGAEPLIKIFDYNGRLIRSFLAYDKNFKGGVKITIGDLNKDNNPEILTVPASKGGPQVRIFNKEGRPIGGFFAFDSKKNGEFVISLRESEQGNVEILVGQKNPF